MSEYSGDSTELLYLRARNYSPSIGRFISRDDWAGYINSPLSLNRWNYVEGNPVNYTDPTGHISTNYSYITGNYLTDTRETYFTRNLESDDKDADAYTTVAGPNVPVNPLDYVLAAINCGKYLDQFEWWRKFTRWGAGYGPDAKSVVYYFPWALSIRRDDLHGIAVSHVAIYAYTDVENVLIRTKMSDKYGVIVYDQVSPSIPQLEMTNMYLSSHFYRYDFPFYIPEDQNNYKVTIEVLFFARQGLGNYTGKTVHEIEN